MSFFKMTLGLSVGAVLALSACETLRTAPERGDKEIETKTLVPVPGSRAGNGNGGVLLVAEMKGVTRDDFTCRWRLINQESGKSFFVTIRANDKNVFEKLDPGNYKTGRLGCGIGKVWEIDNVFPEGFRVEDGRVSYIGKLLFEFDGSELSTLRKAPRGDSSDAMAAAIASTPASGMEVISGFTGLTVNRAIANTPKREGFDVFAKGLDNANTALEPLMNSLKKCATAEGDSAQLGNLEYIAVYKAGRFSEMKSRDATGLSDRMRSCIEHGMMAYHPLSKSDIEVRVRY